MAHIQVTMSKGTTADQRRRIAKRLTDVLLQETQLDARDVSLCLVEIEADSFAEAGTLVVDRNDANKKIQTQTGKGSNRCVLQPIGVDIRKFSAARSDWILSPLWWKSFGYLAASVAIFGLTASLWMGEFKSKEDGWMTVLNRAEAAGLGGDPNEARWLYSEAATVAFWHNDWAGILAAVCGMKNLDGMKAYNSKIHPMLVKAMIAAEAKKSRGGMTLVSRMFAAFGEERAAGKALSRIRPDWPEDTPPQATFAGC